MSATTTLEPAQKPGRSRQDYGTPPEFIDAVIRRFGPIVFDLAASSANTKANEFYDERLDSLSKHWARVHPTGNLWLNPPFGNIDPWAEKCAKECLDRQGMIFLLTPASIGTNWFADHVNRKAMVLGLSPRLTFEGEKDPYPKDLMLAIFSRSVSGFDVWRWK